MDMEYQEEEIGMMPYQETIPPMYLFGLLLIAGFVVMIFMQNKIIRLLRKKH